MLWNLAVRSHRRRDPVAVAIPSPSRSGSETTAGSRGDGRKSFFAADDYEGPEFARDQREIAISRFFAGDRNLCGHCNLRSISNLHSHRNSRPLYHRLRDCDGLSGAQFLLPSCLTPPAGVVHAGRNIQRKTEKRDTGKN